MRSWLKAPHPIPYQGSKRNIAKSVLSFFPKNIARLIEPFGGSAAISIAAALNNVAASFRINDINKPLISLLTEIVDNPKRISDSYERIWNEQLGQERQYYDRIRDIFNKTKSPEYLLYLLARCVKASIRYNSYGEFNQSPDNRRKGRNPQSMRDDIYAVSNLLKGKVVLSSLDYRKVLAESNENDLVYMDPPYQGVSNKRDPRYYGGLLVEELIEVLRDLNQRNLSYILSYDGKKGSKQYGNFLPSNLELHHIQLKVGRSSQSTLLGGDDITYESLYLSKSLLSRLKATPGNFIDNSNYEHHAQLTLSI